MKFKQAENRFKRLKAQFEAGTMNETEFRTKLEDLMIRDEQGRWWMVGYETERWYRHDGTHWVRTDLPQNLTSSLKWVAIVWITLGWAIGSAVGWAIWMSIGTAIGDPIAEAMGGAIVGAIGGLVTAITFRNEDILSDWKSMLWITLGWTIGVAIGWASRPETNWAIGGLVTAITLRNEDILSDWKSVLWITLAWTIGGTFAAVISPPISEIIGQIVGWAIGGAIGVAIGGFVTIWQIREGK